MRKGSGVIGDGEFVARSHHVAIPPDVNAIQMHCITWAIRNRMDAFINFPQH